MLPRVMAPIAPKRRDIEVQRGDEDIEQDAQVGYAVQCGQNRTSEKCCVQLRRDLPKARRAEQHADQDLHHGDGRHPA